MQTTTVSRLDFGNGIHAIDAAYVRHQLAAIHLIVDGGRAAFVDTGSNHSLPGALAVLAELGLTPDDVDYVLLTHIHLDHAGGAGAMMRAFPNAKLVVHPRGARHMIEPAKLWAATEEVYGKERAQALYGELVPVPAARVIEATEGLRLTLGARTLSFHDCPGHAKHHVFIHDHAANGLFTGDTFGLSYLECDVDGRAFIFPTTTPSQFDPEAMRESIRRMLACQPEAVYLTHFSRRTPPAALGADLLRRLDGMVALAREAARKVGGEAGVSRSTAPRLPNGPTEGRHSTSEAGGTATGNSPSTALRQSPGRGHAAPSPDGSEEFDTEAVKAEIESRLRTYLLAEARAHGVGLSDAALLDIWGMDLELDAQGLAIWLAGQ